MNPAAGWLAERLGVDLSDPALLARALTHRSHGSVNNERLEYLGDAVLSFLVAEMLFLRFPDASEGELSRFRASLVSGEALAATAASLGLGEQLLLGEGEMKSGGHRRATILADALEAVVGAVYLDQGIEAARQVAGRLFAGRDRRAAVGIGTRRTPRRGCRNGSRAADFRFPTTPCSRSAASRTTSVSASAATFRRSRSRPLPTAAAGGARSRKPHSESCRIRR